MKSSLRNRRWVRPIKSFIRKAASYRRRVSLPYNADNPVIYDKDEAINCYTDEYLMACASSGDIDFAAMITSSSISPFNRWVTSADYERMVAEREVMIDHARNSGFQNIPGHVRGTKGHLERPLSGHILQTRPFESDGARRIVEVARSANPEKPVVAVMCGPLTVLADAYLIDPSISNRIVTAWFGGGLHDMGDYNGLADPWAAFIVLQEFRMVQFPVKTPKKRFAYSPVVPKARLSELPDTALRKWMIDKEHPNGAPGACDADAPPAISVMRPGYALRVRNVVFSHWHQVDGKSVPHYKRGSKSKTWVVEEADRDAATQEWWRALKNPRAYHSMAI